MGKFLGCELTGEAGFVCRSPASRNAFVKGFEGGNGMIEHASFSSEVRQHFLNIHVSASAVILKQVIPSIDSRSGKVQHCVCSDFGTRLGLSSKLLIYRGLLEFKTGFPWNRNIVGYGSSRREGRYEATSRVLVCVQTPAIYENRRDRKPNRAVK